MPLGNNFQTLAAMTSSAYFATPRRSFLPSYAHEKNHRLRVHLPPWFVPISCTIRNRRLRFFVPNLRRLYATSVLCFGRRTGSAILFFAFLLFVLFVFSLAKSLVARPKWSRPFIGDPNTLIFESEDLQRIWHWEISSGHYPSHHPSAFYFVTELHIYVNVLFSTAAALFSYTTP